MFDFVFFYLKYSELMETTTKTTTTTIIFIVMTTTTTTTTNSWIHCLTSSIIFLPDAIIQGTDPKIGRLGSPGGSCQSLQKFYFGKFPFLESNKKVVQFFLKLLDILPKYPQYQFLITIVNKLCPLQCKYNVSYILV